MKIQKVSLGQFFTKMDYWLTPQVWSFIQSQNKSIAYDPFAGQGDLLKAMQAMGFQTVVGFDIDPHHGFEYQDSLSAIKPVRDAIIITNPPYLSNYSAARKKLSEPLQKYFLNQRHSDLYLIALEKMIATNLPVVAIIPETFLLSSSTFINQCHSITILENNPFVDTDVPVCVACFDGIVKPLAKLSIYKNDQYIVDGKTLFEMKPKPKKNITMTFNKMNGWLALRAVDSTNSEKPIEFNYRDHIDYHWEEGIKVSSRLYTLIDVYCPIGRRDDFIRLLNQELQHLRSISHDLVLSPFKGNTKIGSRRRRLDYQTARALIEVVSHQLAIRK